MDKRIRQVSLVAICSFCVFRHIGNAADGSDALESLYRKADVIPGVMYKTLQKEGYVNAPEQPGSIFQVWRKGRLVRVDLLSGRRGVGTRSVVRPDGQYFSDPKRIQKSGL